SHTPNDGLATDSYESDIQFNTDAEEVEHAPENSFKFIQYIIIISSLIYICVSQHRSSYFSSQRNHPFEL
ncbi:hypothetical protein V5O48_004770, partial [Marasmius crinis-equi]